VSGQLLTGVTIYLSLVVLLGGLAVVGIPCLAAVRTGAAVGELLLVGQGLIDVATLMNGHRPEEIATHLGYLVVSISLFPILLDRPARREDEARPRGLDAAVTAVAAAVSIVVTVRLHATWARMRLLVAAYTVLAIAAGGRAAVQLGPRPVRRRCRTPSQPLRQ